MLHAVPIASAPSGATPAQTDAGVSDKVEAAKPACKDAIAVYPWLCARERRQE